MTCPKIDKVSISLSNKEVIVNSNKLFIPLMLLKLITGQKPQITKAKKSIAQFKLREGKALGCKVTLRGEKMYSFLDKIFYIILPQIFEIKTKKIKSNLNSLSIGIEDLSIFPELESQYDLLKTIQGANINITLKNNKFQKISNDLFSGLKIPVSIK
jgi:large subunit ribosomal protein L5